jgi:uncharacterized protein
VIVVDANLLLYAYSRSAAQHAGAKAWLEKVLSEPEPVGIPWSSIAAFLRIITHPTLPSGQMSMPDAVEVVRQWMEQSNVYLLAPTEKHWGLFEQMLLGGQARGALTSDAELAALTIEYGGVLHTTDRDFARFPQLRWVNPLAE